MSFKEFLSSKRAKVRVYHVSPKSDIHHLKPTGYHSGQQSVAMRQEGIYVAPKFSDAVAWSTSYILYKKGNTQKPNERLKEKGQGGGNHTKDLIYKNLTIYEIEIPKDLLKRVWKSGFWEAEYFIPKEYMNQMRIIKSQTYSKDELLKLYNRSTNKRQEFHSKAIDGKIKAISKKHLAAKYYVELTDLLNNKLLQKHDASVNHILTNTIKPKIEKLRNYIFAYPDFIHAQLVVLDNKQKAEVNRIYNEVKSLLAKLG